MDFCLLVSLAAASHVLAKVVVCLIGAAALYCACFLYEDEEGKLQNRLEQIWISIDDKRHTGEPLALASKSAGIIDRGLNRILGNKLISLRMVGMSSSLSVVTLYVRVIPIWMGIYSWVLVIVLLLSIFAIVHAARRPQSRSGALMLLLPFLLYIGSIIYLDNHRAPAFLATGAIVISIIFDAVFIVSVRASLKKVMAMPRAIWLLVALAIQLVVVFVLTLSPLFLSYFLLLHGLLTPDILFQTDRIPAWFVLNNLDIFNTPTVLFSISFIVLLLFLCLHRVAYRCFWPILGRLFYPLARYKVISNRKAMIGISIACFAVAAPPFAELLKKASEWFH